MIKTTISLSAPAQVETEALVALVLDDSDPSSSDRDKNPQLKTAMSDAVVSSATAELLASGEVSA
ncbi:MAG TPA: hypothetical protein VM715_23190, partial [Candidatus Acidoferrum sp.]|nr:hypothetical protein [Candidatus Acidoferrum sp.]